MASLPVSRPNLSGPGPGGGGRGSVSAVSEVGLMSAWGAPEFSRLLDLGLACLDVSFVQMREFVVWGRLPAPEEAAASLSGSLFRSHSAAYWLAEAERPGGLVRWARAQTSPTSLTLAPHLGPSLLALSALTGGGCGAVAFCNAFFLTYFLLVRSVFPAFSERIAAWICTRSPFCENTRAVARGYRGLVKRFLAFVFQRSSCDPPLLRQNPRPVERYFAIKNYVPGLDPHSCVTLPSYSLWARAHAGELDPREIRDRVTPSAAAPPCVADHASALLATLQKKASDTPCGNPIQWMWYRLLVNSCLRGARCLLPVPAVPECGRRMGGGGEEEREPECPARLLTGPGGQCLSRDVFVAVVSRNVLSCLLNVPAVGPLAYKCFRSRSPSRPVCGPDHPPLAVFCLDCGYCLNFGKQTGGGGALNSFKPTLQFYPRDQKEKHVLTCHASGRVYCSNCGSPAVGCLRLAEPPSARSGWQPRIRAVLPHNAAYELDRGSRLLDAIVPCLGPSRTCMRPVVLRGVTVRQLLYLTLRADARAVCPGCQQRRQAPEDSRDEAHPLSSCLEVELPPGERCEGCRLYHARYGTPAAQAHPPGEAGGGFSGQPPAS
ncbi:BFRF2 [Macacine gammaherpesvirus 4]|uniref:BFRF2 n=1 Tax=Macacine gammaherpesvirus 4 TaxID=45455 RepID=Q8UZJ0_9GAMA|nr:BFRF2 [Macacine gammaherpesvirus 4]AAK95419.1 BFRF2 [Macacine gammaherpesvirus 4]